MLLLKKLSFFFSDSRYAHLVGQTVWHPFREEEIPIIADSYVDPEFGTGAVKITPAHDPNDFEIGVGHGLPVLKVFNEDGTVNEHGGEFRVSLILDFIFF